MLRRPQAAPRGSACPGARIASFTGCTTFTAVVKRQDSVKLAGFFAAEALRVLRGVPGLAVVNEPAGADLGADAMLEFAGSNARGRAG